MLLTHLFMSLMLLLQQEHFKEVECFRQSYEPLLVQHGVDIVLNGHVHAYERIKPVVNYKVCVYQ
jgi:hypothetical protein